MSPIPTGRLFRTDTGSDLVLSRTFRASAEDVWASLTEPERTARWFGPWKGDAAHETRAEGYVDSELYGRRRPVSRGTVNLFVNQADPNRKKMLYRLFFTADDGRPQEANATHSRAR